MVLDLNMGRFISSFLFMCLGLGQTTTSISGDIDRLISDDIINMRTCPDYVDSCIYVCDNGSVNPCHPENIYSIAIDTSGDGESTEGSRYRIYFPWEHEEMTANKFTVTASWPCLSPTAVYASGNYAYWDIYGHDDCPGTVQGSIWYGDDCQDEDGNIGSEDCQELVGRFCFAPGDTLDWPEEADQSIGNDVCDACWMSSPAWSYYDSMTYADSLLSPGICEFYDHCHHSAPDSILCGIGYMDDADTANVFIDEKYNVPDGYLMTNHPNPFNPSTKILYSIANKDHVSIVIFNIMGNKIRTLFNGYQSTGRHTIEWDSSNDQGVSVSAGMYIYVLQTGDQILTGKMILLR